MMMKVMIISLTSLTYYLTEMLTIFSIIIDCEYYFSHFRRFVKSMAYGGVHAANYRFNHDSNHHHEVAGYDIDIFLNQKNAMDYMCAMYV